MDDKLIEKIISVAYGDAGIADRLYINMLAKKNKEVLNLLNEYKKTAQEIHSLKEDELPEEILNRVETAIGINSKNRFTLIGDLMSLFVTRPVITSAAALILVISFITTMLVFKQNNEIEYTQEEIEIAGMQAKQVFEKINEIFNKTEIYVKENVLTDNVAKPIDESCNKVINTIKEGKIK
jgi:hypothetical protein